MRIAANGKLVTARERHSVSSSNGQYILKVHAIVNTRQLPIQPYIPAHPADALVHFAGSCRKPCIAQVSFPKKRKGIHTQRTTHPLISERYRRFSLAWQRNDMQGICRRGVRQKAVLVAKRIPTRSLRWGLVLRCLCADDVIDSYGAGTSPNCIIEVISSQ